jgi:SSS family solute:Na+ symporter
MWSRLAVILCYLFIMLLFGIAFRKKSKEGRIEFYLAGRNVSKLLLFFTMAATNFSAFTIFGFSGAGFRMGYSFYPVMGFGTGFMALSFFIIGQKILLLSKQRGYLTPSDFVGDRYNSPFLKRLFSLVMVVFTLPYIAIQAIASGTSLQSLFGLPYLAGAALVTLFIVAYVSLGGLRSIVWTDLIQGIMMVAFTAASFFIIVRGSGGFVVSNAGIRKVFPEAFLRPGINGPMVPGIWAGYMLLWFFADPMFPQLFQRFMIAKDRAALNTTMVFYPIITTFLFFFTVSIGVLGRGSFPDLDAGSSDTIFPLLLSRYAGDILSTLLLTGSIAALMSTMDSQLLTLTSMITNDFFERKKKRILTEKLTIIILGLLGFLIAIRPPLTILDFINKTTFNGLAVLAPTVLGGLYWKKANRYGATTSIFAGEAMVILYYLGMVKTPDLHPIIPILAVTGAVFICVSFLSNSNRDNSGIVFSVRRKALCWAPVFIVLFLLGNDFWAWGRIPVTILGLPLWIWYYFLLGVLLSLVYRLFSRSMENIRESNAVRESDTGGRHTGS